VPIHPKHVLGESVPDAPRPFVGREELVSVFRQALLVRAPAAKPVLVLHGPGGIGKSSLRRQLMKTLESSPGIISGLLDFNVADYRTPETALFHLRRKLGEEFRVRFPTFDIAHAAYWRKAHPGVTLERHESGLLKTGDKVGEIAGQLGAVSVVGLIPKLAVIAARGGMFLREWGRRRGSEDL
jgi:hypothetical protein